MAPILTQNYWPGRHSFYPIAPMTFVGIQGSYIWFDKSGSRFTKQGCEWEFKKRAEIVLKTQKMAWNTRKGTFLGISTSRKELNSHTPELKVAPGSYKILVNWEPLLRKSSSQFPTSCFSPCQLGWLKHEFHHFLCHFWMWSTEDSISTIFTGLGTVWKNVNGYLTTVIFNMFFAITESRLLKIAY